MMRKLLAWISTVAILFATNALAAENAAVDAAVKQACKLGDVSEQIVNSIQHPTSNADRDFREATDEWRHRYNKSANAGWAKTLRKFAEDRFRKAPRATEYDASACASLKPLYAIAFSAQRISGSIVPGAFLVRSGRKLQMPKAVDVIGDRCNFLPIDQPRPPACPN